MKKLYLVVLILTCFAGLSVKASHFAGGELLLTYQSGNDYKIRLKYYYDSWARANLGGSPPPTGATANIYEKGTNRQIGNSYALVFTDSASIPFNQSACQNPYIAPVGVTTLNFEATVTLSPTIYTSRRGYYIIVTDCCRNASTTNLANPGSQSITMYTEFPAVVAGGRPFINSSPELAPPPANLGCVGRPYIYNLGAHDPDTVPGDSLVYYLTNPISTFGPPAVPVTWASGYSVTNQIPGTVRLGINRTNGHIVLTPNKVGLFAYAIKVEEWRNHVKIGEITRQFQLYVQDCPPLVIPGTRPGVTDPDIVKVNGADTLYYYQRKSRYDIKPVYFKYIVNPKSNLKPGVDDSTEVKYRIKFRPKNSLRSNFDSLTCKLIDSVDVVRDSTGSTSGSVPSIDTNLVYTTKSFRRVYYFVLNKCVLCNPGDTAKYDVIITPQGCHQDKGDTALTKFFVKPPYIPLPRFSKQYVQVGKPVQIIRDSLDRRLHADTITFTQGDSILLDLVSYRDPNYNYDSLKTYSYSNDLGDTTSPFHKFGPTLVSKRRGQDSLVYRFFYKTNCNDLLKMRKGPMKLKFWVGTNTCGNNKFIYDTLVTYIVVKKVSDTLPKFTFTPSDSTLRIDSISKYERTLTVEQGHPIPLSILGKSATKDTIWFELKGNSAAFQDTAMRFRRYGTRSQYFQGFVRYYLYNDLSHLLFNCEDVGKPLSIKIIAHSKYCGSPVKDSVLINFKVIDSNKPSVLGTTLPHYQSHQKNYTWYVSPGDSISHRFYGNDPDTSMMSLNFKAINFKPSAYNMKFRNVYGHDSVGTSFTWSPKCSMVGLQSNPLELLVTLTDSVCAPANIDSLNIHIFLVDSANFPVKHFIVLTPNGDQKNDKLYAKTIVPHDNCNGSFERIEIFSRWGKKLFESTDKDFEWDPINLPSGAYFFTATFGGKAGTSWIQVLKD